MSFSIDQFWKEVSSVVGEAIDFRRLCAREVAALNEDPANRVNESSFFSSLQTAGAPSAALTKLRRVWEGEFNRFRELSKIIPQRTPPLKLFHVCAASIAGKFDRPLDKALAKYWMNFAVDPADEGRLKELLEAMERFRVDPEWTEELFNTWKFLFSPGAHADMEAKAPDLYYEVYDDATRHLALVSAYPADNSVSYIREYREAELNLAMEMLRENAVLVVLGHPGWRPMLGELDLWVETLKLKLSSDGVEVVDMLRGPIDEAKLIGRLGDDKPAAVFAKRSTLDDNLTRYLKESYFEPNKPDNNPFSDPMRRLILIEDTNWRPHERAAEGISPLLRDIGIGGEVPVIAIEHKRLNEKQASQILFGEYSDQMHDMLELSVRYPMLPNNMLELSGRLEGRKKFNAVMEARVINQSFHQAFDGNAPTLPKAVIMPNGKWGRYLDRLKGLAATNFVTMRSCATPFRTFQMTL